MNKEDFLFTEQYIHGNPRPVVLKKSDISFITKDENTGKALVGSINGDGLILLDIDYDDLLIDLFNQ